MWRHIRLSLKVRLLLLVGCLLAPSSYASELNLSNDVLDKVEKVRVGRNMAWNQLERFVRTGAVDSFKEELYRYNTAGLLQDKDSGYFEVLHAIATRRPRQQSTQFLQPLLKSLCSKNIIELLPDLIEYFDLDALLLLRKYCPVGGQHMQTLLEILPEAQARNPLARYLVEYWDDPAALEFTKCPFKTDIIFSDAAHTLDQTIVPRRFNQEGLAEDGREIFERIDRGTLSLKYHNIILFSEQMSRDSLVEMIPPLLRLLDTETQSDAKIQLRQLETWMDRFEGSFSMAVLVGDRVHLWRKGPGSFVVMARNAADDIEEVLYPLGNSFKTPSSTLKYTSVPIGLEALIVYCSAAVIDRIHLHDLLGTTLHMTDDFDGLVFNLKYFFDKNIKPKIQGTGGDRAIDGSVIFRVFQVGENKVRPQLPRSRQRVRRPRSFRIWSIDTENDERSTRDTRESDISLGPNFRNFHRRDDPLWSIMNESEASYDDNDLVSSDEGEFEETMFERRRWWADASDLSHQPESGGYDSSMSRDFFYPHHPHHGHDASTGFDFDTTMNQLRE